MKIDIFASPGPLLPARTRSSDKRSRACEDRLHCGGGAATSHVPVLLLCSIAPRLTDRRTGVCMRATSSSIRVSTETQSTVRRSRDGRPHPRLARRRGLHEATSPQHVRLSIYSASGRPRALGSPSTAHSDSRPIVTHPARCVAPSEPTEAACVAAVHGARSEFAWRGRCENVTARMSRKKFRAHEAQHALEHGKKVMAWS